MRVVGSKKASFLRLWILSVALLLSGCLNPSNPPPQEPSKEGFPESFISPIVVDAGEGKYLTIFAHYAPGEPRVWVLMVDGGERVWEKEYGFGESGRGVASSAFRSAEGGFVLGGSAYSSPELFVLRITEEGTKVWSRDYVFPTYERYHHVVRDMTELENGTILVTGEISSTGPVPLRLKSISVLLGPDGEVLREFDWGGGGFVKSPDGVILFLTYKEGFGSEWSSDKIVKLDRDLRITWSRTVSLPSGTKIRMEALGRVGEDYLAVGLSQGPEGGRIVLVRFDEEGTVLSTKEISEIPFLHLLGARVEEDGVVLWVQNGTVENPTFRVVRIDLEGRTIWERAFEGSQTGTVGRGSNGGYVVLLEGLRFVKLSSAGEVVEERRL